MEGVVTEGLHGRGKRELNMRRTTEGRAWHRDSVGLDGEERGLEK